MTSKGNTLSNNGSVFIITILILSLLSTLGLALMTASTANYIMSASCIDANKAYYAADGIMEQIFVTLKRLSLQCNRNQMPLKIVEAFNDIINRETDPDNGIFVDINYDTGVITKFNNIVFPVTVTYTMNKISKKIKAEFDLQISADVGPLFAYPFVCGNDLVGMPVGGNPKKEVSLKFIHKEESIHVGGDVKTIEFKSHPPAVIVDQYINDMFDRFIHTGFNYSDFGCEPIFLIRTDGNTLEIDLDFLDNIGKEDILAISTGDVLFKSVTNSSFHSELVVVAKGDIVFNIPDNKNIHISKLSAATVEQLINNKISNFGEIQVFFEALGHLQTVNQDVRIISWREVN